MNSVFNHLMMKKRNKIILIVLAVLFVGGFAFAYGNAELFQGRMSNSSKSFPVYDENRCYDSDGGENYEEKGTIYGRIDRSEYGSKMDVCTTRTKIREYYCNGQYVQSKEYDCKNGCSQGVCNEPVVQADAYCNQKHFKAAFLVIYENQTQLTAGVIDLVDDIHSNLPAAFSYATDNLATIEVDKVEYVKDIDDFYHVTDDGTDIFQTELLTKYFYQNHPDDYDFIIFGKAFDSGTTNSGTGNVNDGIQGIGEDVSDDEVVNELYGSNGKLRMFIHLADLINFGYFGPVPTNNVVHEIGHAWCCGVGDDASVAGGNLGIRNGSHWTPGLESGDSDTLLFARHWESNGDGTYHAVLGDDNSMKKYHPFVLYFMGLLPQDKYADKYNVYDISPVADVDDWWNHETAPLLKTVSVNDIIAVEGERKCEL